jgi:DNA-nicking Smr family endonuclease
VKIRRLAELNSLRRALQRSASDAVEHDIAERAAAERERRRHAENQQGLFARSVGAVHRLPDSGLAEIDSPRPPAQPRQREADERAALQESLSDEVNLDSLLLTDDGLSYRRPGIGPDVVTRLRRGHWALQGQIDLHGLNRDEARAALAGYLIEARRRGLRCLRVVHGKGHGSPGRQPVLKARVQRWLAQNAEVIAFAQASGPQGGAGALMVLLAG